MSVELLELAHALGNHPLRLALPGEGSCAMKLSDQQFLVSARGANLSALTETDLAALDLAKMAELSVPDSVSEEDIAEAQANENSIDPSLDAALHAYLFSFPGIRFAAHTQPVAVNQIICSPRARQFADRRTVPSEIVAFGAASLLVPYADPGLPLVREVRRKMILWRDRNKTTPRLVLLQNHGMIVLGQSGEDVLRITEMTLKSAEIFIGAAMMGGPVFLTPNNVTQVEALREL